jgi:hypothetical protein
MPASIRAFFFLLHQMRLASVALLLLHAAACECMAKLEKGTSALPAFALSSTSGAQLQALFPPMPNHQCPTTFPTMFSTIAAKRSGARDSR